jgi:type I restriction enzyme, S subunit
MILTPYFKYLFESEDVQNYLSGLTHGSAIKNVVSVDFLKRMKFALPPIKEQQKIASILSKVDELIQKTSQVIQQTQRLKKGLTQKLFTKGIGHAKFKRSKIGIIPEDWEIRPLQKLSAKIVDGTHFTPTYMEEGVPFLRITDIQSENIDWKNVKKINLAEHNELIRRCNPEKGDILLSKNGTVCITKLVDWDNPFSIFVSICLIKPLSEVINNRYLTYVLPSGLCLRQIRLRSKQETVTNLHLEEIRELLIPLPSIQEQQKIVSILDVTNSYMQKRRLYKTQLEKLKKGLMQVLLAGKIRVKLQ